MRARSEQRLCARVDQLDADHVVAGDALDPSANVDLQHVIVALEQQTIQMMFSCVVSVNDLHRKSPERQKVAIGGQLFADTGTADFQNIGLGQQRVAVKRLSHCTAETSAIVKSDVCFIGMLDLNFHRHWTGVGEHLNGANLHSLTSGKLTGQGLNRR